MKYLIDFAALALLYAFVFFRKWKLKGKDVLLVNTLMYICTLFYVDAGYNIPPVHPEPSL